MLASTDAAGMPRFRFSLLRIRDNGGGVGRGEKTAYISYSDSTIVYFPPFPFSSANAEVDVELSIL